MYETLVPLSQHMAQSTVGGESMCKPIVARTFRFRDASASEALRDVPMKVSGVERIPTNSDREKLRVASVARNMPSSKSEKHWMSTRCWSVRWSLIRSAIVVGRTRLSSVKLRKDVPSMAYYFKSGGSELAETCQLTWLEMLLK